MNFLLKMMKDFWLAVWPRDYDSSWDSYLASRRLAYQEKTTR